jgi:hypothetical protein
VDSASNPLAALQPIGIAEAGLKRLNLSSRRKSTVVNALVRKKKEA